MISSARPATDALSGTISEFEILTLDAFRRRLGLSVSAWRSMRAAGAPVARIGKRTYISGKLWCRWVEAQAAAEGTVDA